MKFTNNNRVLVTLKSLFLCSLEQYIFEMSDTEKTSFIEPFTAEWCYLEALELVEKEIEKNPLTTECARCNNGFITIKMTTIGGKKDGYTTSASIPCSECDGKGNIDLETARSQLVDKFIWCQCEETPDFDYDAEHATDGHEVFGNDTYLCTHCSMVSQFG